VSLCITEHRACKASGRVELQIQMFLFDRFLTARPRDESFLIALHPWLAVSGIRNYITRRSL